MKKEVNPDDYIERGQKHDKLASKNLRGAKIAQGGRRKGLLNLAYGAAIDAAGDYASAAEISNQEDVFELYSWAIDSANVALTAKPEDPEALSLIERYQDQMSGSIGDSTEGGLEHIATSAILGVSFIFALDLIAPKLTGSAIASGNTPADMGAGLLLLAACIATMFLITRKNTTKTKTKPAKKSIKKTKKISKQPKKK